MQLLGGVPILAFHRLDAEPLLEGRMDALAVDLADVVAVRRFRRLARDRTPAVRDRQVSPARVEALDLSGSASTPGRAPSSQLNSWA